MLSLICEKVQSSAEILNYATTKAAIVGFTKGLLFYHSHYNFVIDIFLLKGLAEKMVKKGI
jgi:hypothetical protein